MIKLRKLNVSVKWTAETQTQLKSQLQYVELKKKKKRGLWLKSPSSLMAEVGKVSGYFDAQRNRWKRAPSPRFAGESWTLPLTCLTSTSQT